jgi:dUTP pyrophosphatase
MNIIRGKMGWNSANEIFDPVARAVLNSHVSKDDAVNILTTLIRNLQSEDWDTEDESLEEFAAWPEVVEAFKLCGVPHYSTFDEDWSATDSHKLQVKILRLDKNLPVPAYAKDGDAGVDLYSTEVFCLDPKERKLVSTGVAVEIPKGYVGLVHPRSGLAHEYGISIVNAPGTIDAGYRGEIKVNLINLSSETVVFNQASRVAQLVFQKVEAVDFVEVDELAESARGADGHGSTGT